MGLAHGQTPPFDISTPEINSLIKLKHGLISSCDYFEVRRPKLSIDGFSSGLKRYVFRYNSNTNSYDYIATYKGCRSLIQSPQNVRDVSNLNCLFDTHGGQQIYHTVPSGLNKAIEEIFKTPLYGQDVFIDCCTPWVFDLFGIGTKMISGIFTTYVNRYGVLKNSETIYFKNNSSTKHFFKLTDNMACPEPSGTCYFTYNDNNQYCRTTTQSKCELLNGNWYQNSGCQTGSCVLIDNSGCYVTNQWICLYGGNGSGNWTQGANC